MSNVVPIHALRNRLGTYRLMVSLAVEILEKDRLPNLTENLAMTNVLSMLRDYATLEERTGGDAA